MLTTPITRVRLPSSIARVRSFQCATLRIEDNAVELFIVSLNSSYRKIHRSSLLEIVTHWQTHEPSLLIPEAQ